MAKPDRIRVPVEVLMPSLADLLDAAVDEVYDDPGETVGVVTLADRLLDRLSEDPRWDGLAARFWDAVEEYMAQQAPAAVQALVQAEVARQLLMTAPSASVRGKPSSRAEAMVATEVTTQLRARFGPVVEEALAGLRRELETVARDAVTSFEQGLRYGQGPTWPGDGG